MTEAEERLTELRTRLVEKAYLFDEPHSYIRAVEDALEAVTQELPEIRAEEGTLI